MGRTRNARRTVLIAGAVVLVAALVAVAAWWGLLRTPPSEVSGRVWTHADDGLLVLGTAGWHTLSTSDGLEVRRGDELVRTITDEDAPLVPDAISTEGVVVDAEEDTLRLFGEDGAHRVDTRAVVEAFDPEGPWPGTDLEVLGLTRSHAVVITCFAPAPSSLRDSAPDAYAGVAGVELESGEVTWAEQLELPCGSELQWWFAPENGPQEVALIGAVSGPGLTAVDLTNGKSLYHWGDSDTHDVGLQGATAIVVDRDQVEVVDLRRRRTLSSEVCERARVSGAPVGSVVPPDASLAADCTGGSLVWDGHRLVDAPEGLSGNEPLEGREASVGRWAFERTGEQVTVRDVLGEHEPFTVTLTEDARIYGEPGRLITFFAPTEASGEASRVWAFDTHDGSTVIDASGAMSTSIDVSTDGAIALSSTKEETWVAAATR